MKLKAAYHTYLHRTEAQPRTEPFEIDWDTTTNYTIPLHHHDFTELVVVLSGTGIHVTEEGEYPIGAGDVFAMSGNQVHGIRQTRNFEHVDVKCAPAHVPRTAELECMAGYQALFTVAPTLRGEAAYRSRLTLSMPQLDHTREILRLILQEYKARQAGYCGVIAAMLVYLVTYISRCYGASSRAGSAPAMRLGQVLSYMREHCAEDLTVEALAQRAAMSASHFFSVFKDVTGLSPLQYVIKLRITEAESLLRQSDMGITDIAYKVGFNDSSYFSEQFKHVMDMTPRDYRRLQHHQEAGELGPARAAPQRAPQRAQRATRSRA